MCRGVQHPLRGLFLRSFPVLRARFTAGYTLYLLFFFTSLDLASDVDTCLENAEDYIQPRSVNFAIDMLVFWRRCWVEWYWSLLVEYSFRIRWILSCRAWIVHELETNLLKYSSVRRDNFLNYSSVFLSKVKLPICRNFTTLFIGDSHLCKNCTCTLPRAIG